MPIMEKTLFLPFPPLLLLLFPHLGASIKPARGFLAVGGLNLFFKTWADTPQKGLESANSAELWSPDNVSCNLPTPPREMWTPSVNVLAGVPLACYLVENLRT